MNKGVLLNPDLSYFENIVDPDLLASGSTLYSSLVEKHMPVTGKLQVNRIENGEDCSEYIYLA